MRCVTRCWDKTRSKTNHIYKHKHVCVCTLYMYMWVCRCECVYVYVYVYVCGRVWARVNVCLGFRSVRVCVGLCRCCQKRPTTVSKETYYSIKRDLLQCVGLCVYTIPNSHEPSSSTHVYVCIPKCMNAYT